jgi:threonine/homoserine/homoserine lactone efflux protein
MSLTSLLAFNLAILGALAVPGPAFLSVVRAALSGGRRHGLTCAAGLAVGATLWSVAALAGLTALFALVPWAYLALKLAGAAYLVWFAAALWRGAGQRVPEAPLRGRGFALGLLTNLSNPKAVFFIAAIFSTVFPAMPQGRAALEVLANHFSLELVWYGAVALVLTTAPMRAAYLRAKARIDRLAAVGLALLALRTAT